jgi:hypothetical protein
MSTRAACAGSEVPPLRHLDARERRARLTGDLPPTNHATNSVDPFARWTALPSSPVVVTPMTTTGRPPRPGGNSGRCAAPNPAGSAGTAGALPTLTDTPVGRVAAQLYPRTSPGATATRPRPRPSDQKTGGRDGPQRNQGRSVRQPIAASFGLVTSVEASTTGIGFPAPFCLASGRGPLAADRFLHRRGRLPPDAAPPTSVLPSSFSRPLRWPRRGLSPRSVT